MATKPLLSWGHACGQDGVLGLTKERMEHTIPFVWGANVWAKWLHKTRPLEGTESGDVIKHGNKTRATLGGHIEAKWLHTPCCLEGPQSKDGPI